MLMADGARFAFGHRFQESSKVIGVRKRSWDLEMELSSLALFYKTMVIFVLREG